MKILFDQGTPLRKGLAEHVISTAYQMGWGNLENGALIAAADKQFEVLVTTDQRLRYQQNLLGKELSILVLPTTSWPVIREHIPEIAAALKALGKGALRELEFENAE